MILDPNPTIMARGVDPDRPAPDMDGYRLPLDLARHGGEFEIDLGDGVWVPGQLHGRIWLSSDDVLCREGDVLAIRYRTFMVRYAIEWLIQTISWGWDDEWCPAQMLYEISDQASDQARKLLDRVERRSLPGRRELHRVRRQLIVDAMAIAVPGKPLSEIVVGYRTLNRNRRVILECGTFMEAWEGATTRPQVRCEGIGLVLADGSVRYGHPLLEQTARFLWGENERQWPVQPTMQALVELSKRIVGSGTSASAEGPPPE